MSTVIEIILAGIKNGLIWSTLVLGVYISFRVLDTADLSIEGTFPLGATICALGLTIGIPPVLSTILGLVGGFLGGLLTGVLHTKLHIPAILSGIITMTALITINMLILGLAKKGTIALGTLAIEANDVFTLPTKWLANLFQSLFGYKNGVITSKLAQIIVTAIFAFACYIAIYYLFGTEAGMALRATGDNKTMAKAQGINTDMMIIIGLAISNALIALSGALFAQAEGTADTTAGRGAIVNGLSAIIIGELIFGRKTFKLSLISCVVGSFIYFTLKYIIVCLGLVSLLYLAQAVIITVLMAIPMIKKKKQVKLNARN